MRMGNPDNRFRVELMPRNPHSGQVYLPGSSIKGAIRTAVVNYFANLDPQSRESVRKAVNAEVSSKRKGWALEDAALNRSRRETERDVFRLVDVEDSALPRGSTRIDRVSNINPGKRGAGKIQIWTERITSLSDGPARAPGFTVTLHIDTLAMGDRRVRASLGRTLDLDAIVKACNRFYWGRMKAEGDKFDGRQSEGSGWKALYSLFPRGRTPDGQIVPIEPSKSYWCTDKRKRMLLRVGRFSHFESLSVDELREGYNAQARKPIKDMGATRTRCVEGDDGRPAMPFGWLLLTMDIC